MRKRKTKKKVVKRRSVKKSTTRRKRKPVVKKKRNTRRKKLSTFSNVKINKDTEKKNLKRNLVTIKVIGIGGSGKNVTNHMIKSGIPGIEFMVANTDLQDIEKSRAETKIHLGESITRGLGTGMNADLGRSAAEEAVIEISEALKGSDLVFVACGMGGGTGTGASPIIAKTARNMGILTIGVVTFPFTFEGNKRAELADIGIKELSRNVDAILVIKNDKILQNSGRETSMAKAFAMSDDILLKAVRGISDLITMPGDINVDFADIKTIMKDSGVALMGVGKSKGAGRADIAVSDAVSSPLLDTSMKGARRVLFSIAASSRSDISMSEVQRIAEKITESVDENAKIIFGTSTDKSLNKGEIRITVLATSFNGEEERNVGKIKEFSMVNNSINSTEDVERIGDDDADIDDEIIDMDDDYEDEDNDEGSGWSMRDLWRR